MDLLNPPARALSKLVNDEHLTVTTALENLAAAMSPNEAMRILTISEKITNLVNLAEYPSDDPQAEDAEREAEPRA